MKKRIICSTYPNFKCIDSADETQFEIQNEYKDGSDIYRNKLKHIIDILEYCCNQTDSIEIQTNDIFIRDLIQEWIPMWKKEESMNERPNSDLLKKIDEFTCNKEIKITHDFTL